MTSDLKPTQVDFALTTLTDSNSNVTVINTNNIKKNVRFGRGRTCTDRNWETHLSPALLSVGGWRVKEESVITFEMKNLQQTRLCLCARELDGSTQSLTRMRSLLSGAASWIGTYTNRYIFHNNFCEFILLSVKHACS